MTIYLRMDGFAPDGFAPASRKSANIMQKESKHGKPMAQKKKEIAKRRKRKKNK